MYLAAREWSSNRTKGWTDSSGRNNRMVNIRMAIEMLSRNMRTWSWELDKVEGR